jgi:hypothetical protein
MTATNDTYRGSVASAVAAKQGTAATADAVRVQALSAALVAYQNGGTYATYQAAVAAADSARLSSYAGAEAIKQTAVETAKNVARDAGEKLTS